MEADLSQNSTGINRSSAQYWIFKHQMLLQWLPHRRYRRLPWQNHCWTHPVQIVNPACIPARHDGAHGHGAGDCDNCIWHPGLRRGETTWKWPDFDPDPVQENLAQLSRRSEASEQGAPPRSQSRLSNSTQVAPRAESPFL